LCKVFGPQHRKGPVSDEEIRSHGCRTIDVARYSVHRDTVVEGNLGSDEGSALHPCFDNEKHVRATCDDSVPSGKAPRFWRSAGRELGTDDTTSVEDRCVEPAMQCWIDNIDTGSQYDVAVSAAQLPLDEPLRLFLVQAH